MPQPLEGLRDEYREGVRASRRRHVIGPEPTPTNLGVVTVPIEQRFDHPAWRDQYEQ
jgi:hypothetical protein